MTPASSVTETGNAVGLLLSFHLVELASGRQPMGFVGMVRERDNAKFDIVPIPSEDWTTANAVARRPNVAAAAWLVTDDEDQELSIYVVRIPAHEHDFDVIVDIRYGRDPSGRLAISKPQFRTPSGDEADLVDSLWSGINAGLSQNAELATAGIAFGGLGAYDAGGDDDDDDDDD
jgi:hypothetical protein